MKEVKIENNELWSMKLLKASLNGVKILLWPLRVLDSFLMRRRVRPDGTKGIAPAEILFVIFVAGIVFSFVYEFIFKGLFIAFGKTLTLVACMILSYLMFYWVETEEEIQNVLAAEIMIKIIFYGFVLSYILLFFVL